jgi:hypothetical protein
LEEFTHIKPSGAHLDPADIAMCPIKAASQFALRDPSLSPRIDQRCGEPIVDFGPKLVRHHASVESK